MHGVPYSGKLAITAAIRVFHSPHPGTHSSNGISCLLRARFNKQGAVTIWFTKLFIDRAALIESPPSGRKVVELASAWHIIIIISRHLLSE